MLQAYAAVNEAEAELTLDTETNGKDIRDGSGYMCSTSLCFNLGETFYVTHAQWRHKDDTENLESAETFAEFKLFIESFPGLLIMHNAKFDLESLLTSGIKYTGRFRCTMLMAHGINENYPFAKDLSSCVRHYVDKDLSKKDDKIFDFLVQTHGWDGVPVGVMAGYAEQDAFITHLLYLAIKDRWKSEVPDTYWEHKAAFMGVVRAMERQGVLIDQTFCKTMERIGLENMDEIKAELKGFNPGSTKDLRRLLIDKLNLPVVKITPAGHKLKKAGEDFDPRDYASFDKEAMEEYDRMLENEEDRTAQLVLAYRGWQKTVSSNYQAYLELVSSDGRLRPNYKLHGTKTGRMSCSKPNLQQLPRASEKPWNGNLKQAFVAAPGYELWEFDYSQLELRLATAYAREESLKAVFNEGRDIFDEMAVDLGLPRQTTKTFVYATQYGAGVDRLMHSLKTTRSVVEQIRQDYKNRYPGFVAVSNRSSALCKRQGKVQLWSGRYRHFWDKQEDAHKAFNSVVQGGAADIVEHVMVRLFKEVQDEISCRMLLQVHDSVVFEIRSDCVEDYKRRVTEIMSDVNHFGDFGVTFAVDGKQLGKAE